MAVIHLGFHLCAGFGACHSHTLGIDDYHVITHLHTGRKSWFVLAKQGTRNARGDPSKDFAIRIHKHPLAFDFTCFRIVRLVHFLILRFYVNRVRERLLHKIFLIDLLTHSPFMRMPLRRASTHGQERDQQESFSFVSQPEPDSLANEQ